MTGEEREPTLSGVGGDRSGRPAPPDGGRQGCCAGRRKPCPYHEGWADATDWLGEQVAGWLASLGYPYDWTFERPPPAPLRTHVEDAWLDAEGVAEPAERRSYRRAVAEAGGW